MTDLSPLLLDELIEEFEKLKDIDGVETYPAPPIPWILILGILAALLLSFLIWKMIKKRQTREIKEPAKSPAQLALLAFDELRRQNFVEAGRFKEFTYEVNIILRRYLEGQFSLQAPEQTTEEFLNSFHFQKTLSEDQRKTLKQFLEYCDLIKYANEKPGVKEAHQLLEEARKFVRQSEFTVDSQLARS